jgi:hypothetical protein
MVENGSCGGGGYDDDDDDEFGNRGLNFFKLMGQIIYIQNLRYP